ncbi:hypothetical protein LRS74_18160 [Streptomyces sp. LX-29]|uniref:hypothetical protein n=1 Tax=Streptomyces sp. LX-29 TaxID=2900152 RepID=UPI00240DE7CF|nr:hypothetical protein [Streptomyces sp. LX-29]WFB08752.1 hypothetical protein LRS74_18160 [Streptomyces sp. LX-29]
MSNQPHDPQHAYDQRQPYGGYDAYGQPYPYGQPQQSYGQQDAYAGYDPHGQQPATDWNGYGEQQAYLHPQAPYGQQDPYAYPPDAQGHAGYQEPYTAPVGADTAYLPQQPADAAAYATPGHPAPTAAPEPPLPAPEPAAAPKPMTAAERARAEGRAQIIDPGMTPALLTAALAGLLAATAPLPRAAVAVVVALLQAVTAAGWFRLNGMWPARQGIALAFAGGLAADAGLLATGKEDAPTVVLGTLGVWLLLVIILQLRNRSTPDERMYSLTTTTVSTALAVLASGYLATAAESSDAVVVGAAAVAVAALARALPLPTAVSVVVALLAAAGAGVGAGQLTDTGATEAAALALAAGVCALIGLRVAAYDYPSRFVHMTAGVALPLAAAAPAVYFIGRAIA